MSIYYRITGNADVRLPFTVVPQADRGNPSTLVNVILDFQTSSQLGERQLELQVLNQQGEAVGPAILASATQGPQESVCYRFAPDITSSNGPGAISTVIPQVSLKQGESPCDRLQIRDANNVDPEGDQLVSVQVIGT